MMDECNWRSRFSARISSQKYSKFTAEQADIAESPSTAETPPPIDLKFFGYFRRSGEHKTIFVSQGDAIFLVQEGNLVALRYKILGIKNDSVLVQDVFNNQRNRSSCYSEVLQGAFAGSCAEEISRASVCMSCNILLSFLPNVVPRMVW